MPPKLTIAPNEAVFNHAGTLFGRGRFFPPLLVASGEGRLFTVPPAAELVKLIHELPPLSPSTKVELITDGRLFFLALGWRKAGNEEFISVKTVPESDWQSRLQLSSTFGNWLDAQDYPVLVLDNGGFILRCNPQGAAHFPTLTRGGKEPLFWSLVDEQEALRLQDIWSLADGDDENGEFHRLLPLRDDAGILLGSVIYAPRPDDETSQLIAAGQRLALEHAGEGLLLLDQFGFILYASANCPAIMGMEETNLVGKRLLSLVRDARQNMLLGRMLAGERIAMPLIVETKPGNEKPVQVRLETVELTPELGERAALALRVKPAQELLKQQDREARLSLLDELLGFGNGPLLASFSTADDTLLYISPNSATWTGITPDQFQLNPRRFWALFPSYLFTTSADAATASNIVIHNTVLDKAEGTIIPVKLQITTDPTRRRKDVFVQALDSLALGEGYAQMLKALDNLNSGYNHRDSIRQILGNLLRLTGSLSAVINIFDAITGTVIGTVMEPGSEDEYISESIPPVILSQAQATTLLTQRAIQHDGAVIKRISIANRGEECGELYLFSPDACKIDEVDLFPWLNLLGLAIVLWRLRNTLAQESELNGILGYGLENIVAHAVQKLAGDLLDLTCAGENTISKLNEVTQGLEKTLISIRELQLFSTLDKLPPESEVLDLEQLLGEVGMDFTARLSQCGGLLTVERGLPQVIAPPEYLRLVFSRLVEFALSHHRSAQNLRLHISAFLLESATRIVFQITPSAVTAEECQALFNPYFVTGNTQQVDLGLALIKKLVETIGGNITVFKDDSDSAFFNMFLPHRLR